MIVVRADDEQKYYTKTQVDSFDFGKRGKGDGNKDEQFTGILGQVMIADLLGFPRPNGLAGYDNGYDLSIFGKRVDVKTMTRTVPMRDDFVHNLIGYQKDYALDYYIFCSFNKKTDELTICGYISKKDFLIKSKYYSEGTKRYRTDGSFLISKAHLYEISQKDLNQINNVIELIKGIISQKEG